MSTDLRQRSSAGPRARVRLAERRMQVRRREGDRSLSRTGLEARLDVRTRTMRSEESREEGIAGPVAVDDVDLYCGDRVPTASRVHRDRP